MQSRGKTPRGVLFFDLRAFYKLCGTNYHTNNLKRLKQKLSKKMCKNFPNIRVTEGNNFSLILPLKARTYVSCRQIDDNIDLTKLENIVVTFGDVEYATEIVENGVQINLPATLKPGTYDILLTADYIDSEIRAAYQSAVTIVPWSSQSTADQYIIGSPLTLQAAYVLSGALTDAELEELKEEWREKNEELAQAITEMEEAKAEYERKALELDGVAQETTSQQILTRTGEAKTAAETAAQAAQAITGYALQGTDPTATNTVLAALIGYTIQEIDGV